MEIEPICLDCKHFMGIKGIGLFCKAFPDGSGIPLAILDSTCVHTIPYPGDRGIRFELLDRAALPVAGPNRTA